MKRYLILPALLLASCAPVISAAQGTASSLTATDSILTFSNGDPQTAVKVVVDVDGAVLSDPRCGPARDGVTVCKLGDVPANSTVVLAFTGKLLNTTSATWRTPTNKLRAIPVSK